MFTHLVKRLTLFAQEGLAQLMVGLNLESNCCFQTLRGHLDLKWESEANKRSNSELQLGLPFEQFERLLFEETIQRD